MKIIVFILFCSFASNVFSQNFNEKSDQGCVASKIRQVKEIPFSNYGDSIYWEIVKGGLFNIPELINLLDDSTNTDISTPYFGNFFTIADISYNIITDIIYQLPTLDLLEKSGCHVEKEKGFFNYWDFLFEKDSNRKKFKENVGIWYKANKDNLFWVETVLHHYTDFSETDSFENPAGGYYILKK